MLSVKSRSVATSTKTQDAGKQGIRGYGGFLKEGSAIRPVVWAQDNNRADARSSSGNSWCRREVSPTPLFLQQFAFYFPSCFLISLFQLLLSGNCFNHLLFRKERRFPLAERGAASDRINADEPLHRRERGCRASLGSPSGAAVSQHPQLSLTAWPAPTAICTGLPGAY